jgi:hypothetical protein
MLPKTEKGRMPMNAIRGDTPFILAKLAPEKVARLVAILKG